MIHHKGTKDEKNGDVTMRIATDTRRSASASFRDRNFYLSVKP